LQPILHWACCLRSMVWQAPCSLQIIAPRNVCENSVAGLL
jgi:hypothetical protein